MEGVGSRCCRASLSQWFVDTLSKNEYGVGKVDSVADVRRPQMSVFAAVLFFHAFQTWKKSCTFAQVQALHAPSPVDEKLGGATPSLFIAGHSGEGHCSYRAGLYRYNDYFDAETRHLG